ncbi:hypothetical protein CERSUDRAFT_118804 [Gelatoporia subvermispora B]|uniref:DUF6534 domain-containing protein n=1 Tax=Ceriporiopsis subvermispora (strain B) TaxID=914234 RepID=M2R2L6_CERS8|nr:hypothetical protein CERSUDRAFT_118804 [Gelatoporia subvermispora B]
MAPSLAAELKLNGTLGSIQLATMLTSTLYGITVLQTYVYSRRSSGDALYIKLAIYALWLLDTLHQAFIFHVSYTYTVTDFGEVLALTHETWSVEGIVIVSNIMYLGIRSIFCQRIWRLSNKNLWIVSLIMICSLGDFGALLAFEIKQKTELHLQFLLLRRLSSAFYAAVTFTIVADLLIAISQTILLWKLRTRVLRTDSIVRTLILYSINTGIITAICALLLCITWAAIPTNLTFIIFFTLLPTLLLNALLATFNARQELREMSSANVISIPLTPTAQISSTSSPRNNRSYGDTRERVPVMPIEIKLERSEVIV